MKRLKKLQFVMMISIVSTLGGCENETQVQTVQWYKVHAEKRQEMLTKCRNNAGQLADTLDCQHAETAEIKIRQENTHE